MIEETESNMIMSAMFFLISSSCGAFGRGTRSCRPPSAPGLKSEVTGRDCKEFKLFAYDKSHVVLPVKLYHSAEHAQLHHK